MNNPLLVVFGLMVILTAIVYAVGKRALWAPAFVMIVMGSGLLFSGGPWSLAGLVLLITGIMLIYKSRK